MKYFFGLLVLAMLPISALAMNRVPDQAGVVLKNGVPCFYSLNPIEKVEPDSKIGISVYGTSAYGYAGTMWQVDFPLKQGNIPVSPESCIPYESISSIKSEYDRRAQPLTTNTVYSISIAGSWIYPQDSSFCIIKNKQGEKYLSEASGNCCTEKPLMQKKRKSRSFLFGLFGL